MLRANAIAKQPQRRDFPGRRWLSVVLRGMHLVAVMALAAQVLGAPSPAIGPTAIAGAVLITGLAQFALDLWSSPTHLFEVAGASVVFKLGLIAVLATQPAWREPLFWTIVGWSALFSHAPGSFRHADWRTGRRQR